MHIHKYKYHIGTAQRIVHSLAKITSLCRIKDSVRNFQLILMCTFWVFYKELILLFIAFNFKCLQSMSSGKECVMCSKGCHMKKIKTLFT